MRTRLSAIVVAVALLGGVAGSHIVEARQAGPRDPKRTLFELANSMGMLRALQQVDSVVTTEVWAKGMLTVAGRTFPVTEYRASLNYVIPGLREDFVRATVDGSTARQIHVVAQTFAWNETERGMNPTPVPAALRERLVHLWTSPMGVVKAASAAGSGATVAAGDGAAVLTFRLPPPVNDVTVRATLRDTKANPELLKAHPLAMAGLVGTYVARVETLGPVATDTSYAEYGDWNWEDYRSDVMLPRRITQKRADGTVLDLTVTNTNTYNPYVVMPVPDSVMKQAGSR
jgi:hypothetical protein